MLATTTIAVRRPTGDEDPYESSAPAVVADNLPAHIGSPSGSDRRQSAEIVAAALVVPQLTPAIEHTDFIDDEATGEQWQVAWVRRRTGLGLDHQRAGLVAVKGAA